MNELSIEQAAQEVRDAQERWEQAHREAESRRADETDALNRLNAAQKKLDQAIHALKQDAPRNTDWHLNKQ